MLSRSLSAPVIPSHPPSQRNDSRPRSAHLLQNTGSAAQASDRRTARLVLVSLASLSLDPDVEDQIDAWRDGLDAQGHRLLHAELGEEPDAIGRLCAMLTPFIDDHTQVVVLHPRDDRNPAADIASAIAQCVARSGIHGPCPLVVDPINLVDGDLEPGLVNVLCGTDAAAPDTADRRKAAARQRVAMGDLRSPVPAGILVAKVNPLTAHERALLDALNAMLAPAEVLCLTLQDPLTDMAELHDLLMQKLTPMTPTMVLTPKKDDLHSLVLRADLVLCLADIPGALQDTNGGTPCNPQLQVLDARTTIDDLAAFASVARLRWSESVAWFDARYLERLQVWLSQPGHCNPSYPFAATAFSRYMTRLLEKTRSDPLAGIEALVSVLGLQCLPPLPPTRRFHELTISGCHFTDLRNLPREIKRLDLQYCLLVDIELDAGAISGCREIHLEGNLLNRIPPSLWQFSGSVDIFLGGNPLPENTRRIIEATRNTPGYTGPRLHCAGGPDTRVSETRLAAALRRVFDAQATWRPPMAWQPALAAMATRQFVAWIRRLAQLPAALRERMAPKLQSLIAQCSLSKSLREVVLQTVHDASTRCDDRILLSWERVQLACKCHNAIRQKWEPGPLITLARQVFRIEQVMKIALEKVGELRVAAIADGDDPQDLDDLETVLACLSMAHGPLAYDNDTGFGQFTHEEISGVTFRDLAQLIKRVRRAENQHFAKFLVGWDPWLNVLKARKPDELAAIRNDVNDEALRQRWERRVRRNAQALGLTGRALEDAVTKGVASIFTERQERKLLKLTNSLLKSMGLASLLAPAWPSDASGD